MRSASEDYNQVLSERRAGRVVNYLQQKCGWAPYRMLTPTGMAEADPLADNTTPAGHGAEPPRGGEYPGQQGRRGPVRRAGRAAARPDCLRARAAGRGMGHLR